MKLSNLKELTKDRDISRNDIVKKVDQFLKMDCDTKSIYQDLTKKKVSQLQEMLKTTTDPKEKKKIEELIKNHVTESETLNNSINYTRSLLHKKSFSCLIRRCFLPAVLIIGVTATIYANLVYSLPFLISGVIAFGLSFLVLMAFDKIYQWANSNEIALVSHYGNTGDSKRKQELEALLASVKTEMENSTTVAGTKNQQNFRDCSKQLITKLENEIKLSVELDNIFSRSSFLNSGNEAFKLDKFLDRFVEFIFFE